MGELRDVPSNLEYQTITYSNGATFEGYVPFAGVGTKRGKPWHVCELCGYTFPEGEGAQIGGTWYCRRYGCVQEVRIAKRRGRGY